MRKQILVSCLCLSMAASLMGGMSVSAEETGLNTEGKLVVGFDAEYPPYGYMDDNGDYARSRAGSWSSSRSTGIPRTLSLIPVPSTASGTDLPWTAEKTPTPSPYLMSTTVK